MFGGQNSPFTGGSVGSKRVLVVDDDQESRNLLSEVLGANGYPVQALEGSEAFWEALSQDSSRAIILVDLRMPGDSGLELLRKLQQRNIKCDAILMTSFLSGTERELAQELGVKGFLEKPFRLSELLRVVGELARKNPIEISS
jgi:CheY-like chemotaxis protein